MGLDYANVTELPGMAVTPLVLEMARTRYHAAASRAPGRDVLELASGPGIGLTWIAKEGRRVVGADISAPLLDEAHRTHEGRIDLARADAQRLPFARGSFDLVLLFEALYYLPDHEAFFAECARVLRPGGMLLLCTANRKRPGFVRSPHATRYLDVAQIEAAAKRHGFVDVAAYGAFAAKPQGILERAVLAGFAIADRVGLIPRSIEGRTRVKRLLYGKLVPLPRDVLPGPDPVEPLARLGDEAAWKVLFVEARRPAA